MYPAISQIIEVLDRHKVDAERIDSLNELSTYVASKVAANETCNLNFICTHNSRRSVLSQVWAAVLADYFNFNVLTFSGGTEVTEVNQRIISSFTRLGFSVNTDRNEQERINEISFSYTADKIVAFSKLFTDESSPKVNFAAVMTCNDAAQKCPLVPGAETRIALTYEDPKKFDDTLIESLAYDSRSVQIAAELFYAFSKVKS